MNAPLQPVRDPSPPRVRPPRWAAVLAVLVVLLGVTAAAVVWGSTRGTLGDTTVTTSSTAIGSAARDAVTGSVDDPAAGWRSDGETVGAWIELSWSTPHAVRRIVLVGPGTGPGITEGFLAFGDGSFVAVTLSPTAATTVVPVTARMVDRVRFTVSAVAPGARGVAVDEIAVQSAPEPGDVVDAEPRDGDVAADAVVTGSPAPYGPTALTDADPATGWVAGPGAWAQLDWARPRELAGVALAGIDLAGLDPTGPAGAGGTVASATLTFGDGTRLPIGAVLADPGRPTVVGFMPRVTTSVRLTVDAVDGAGPAALGELRVVPQGATAAGPAPTAPASTAPGPRPAPTGCRGDATVRPTSGAVVACPTSGAAVEGRVDLHVVTAPGYATVTATAWPADEQLPAGPAASAVPDVNGLAVLAVDAGTAAAGPLTVQVVAEGPGVAPVTAYHQVVRVDGPPAPPVPVSPAAAGRTLVHAEEFDGPLSVSRSGRGADYTAAKPVHDGEQDFGDAVFADPATGPATLTTVDGLLRVDVAPLPAGAVDPQGWGRRHVGGLLASARAGGSGVSARHGYFEARMLAPAAPGTWPAFWMLPTDNLVAPLPVVAEVDAVELYGHEPLGACHATHEYADGRDGGVSRCGPLFATERSALAWHTYGVSITPTGITYTVDGAVVATAPQVEGGDSPMFFLVDLALGGGWPVDLAAVGDRAALYVDHVRVYV